MTAAKRIAQHGARTPMFVSAGYFGWWAVLGFLVAVPATGVWVPASGHDFARVVEISLCLVCAMAFSLQTNGAPPSMAASVTVLVLLALGIASTATASIRPMAIREMTLFVGLANVSGIVAGCVALNGLGVLLATVGLAGASYAALTLLGLAANLAATDALHPFDLLIGYDNGRFFNHVQTSMLPLLAVATLQPFGSRWIKRLAAFGSALGIALLVVSEGRATGLALIVGMAVGIGLFRSTAWPIVRSFLMASACAVPLYLVLFLALPKLLDAPVQSLHLDGVADTGSAHSRFILWQIAVDGIRRSPWLGIGPMHFSHTWNSDAAHPHNVYLQVAEEWGVPMALLLLGVALVGLRRLYRAVRTQRGDPGDRTLGAGLFITLVAVGVDGMLSGNFVMPVSQVWIAVVIGASIGWARRARLAAGSVPTTAVASARWGALRFLPLAAMLWLAASVAPELGAHFLDRRDPSGSATDAGAPRFWSNGWF